MRGGLSGLSSLMRDYAESRDGRIRWWSHLYLFLDSAGRRKKLNSYNRAPWPDRIDAATDKSFNLFHGRGAQCFHPDKWKGLFPYWSNEGKRAYFVVPAKDCKRCEFHEAAKQNGRRKYASCKWYRENSGLESPAQLFVKSMDKAKQMMGIND